MYQTEETKVAAGHEPQFVSVRYSSSVSDCVAIQQP